jgi:hypothetical protein
MFLVWLIPVPVTLMVVILEGIMDDLEKDHP